jgi:hypothetical protein
VVLIKTVSRKWEVTVYLNPTSFRFLMELAKGQLPPHSGYSIASKVSSRGVLTDPSSGCHCFDWYISTRIFWRCWGRGYELCERFNLALPCAERTSLLFVHTGSLWVLQTLISVSNPARSRLTTDATVTAPSFAEQMNAGWSYSGAGGFSYQVGLSFISQSRNNLNYSQGAVAPSWQKNAIAAYNKLYQDSQYSQYQNNAATPDVSAMGRNWIVVINGQGVQEGGTSLSSPLFGSLMAMINAQRVNRGQGLIGFPLPTFYGNTQLFRDVIKGNNQEGETNDPNVWPATAGWDPATGLGESLREGMD